MPTYRTQQNDRLDTICWQHYGQTGVIVRVMEANPGLAAHGPLLPAGLIIKLPDFGSRPATPATRQTLKLWD